MNRQQLLQLLQLREALLVMAGLYEVGDHPEWFDPDFGICANVGAAMYHFMPDDYDPTWDYLQIAFKDMGLDPGYPVTHPRVGASRAYGLGSLWADSEYGDNRRALCRALVAYIEKEANHAT